MTAARPRDASRVRAVARYVLVAALAFAAGGIVFHLAASRHSSDDEHAAHRGGPADSQVWTCAMHPQIRQAGPGKCPLCGMDLIPVGNDTGEADARPERITLSERAKALARLRTTEVRRMADPATEVRLLGRVEADETSIRTVAAWVGGRIDRLHVRVTGERVRAGQTIATLYSPEVFAAHQDLLAARRQAQRMQSASDIARSAADAALEASRDRLRLLGISADRLKTMESQAQPARQIAIHTPFAGTVIERLATEGSYITTGEPLYRIANLARVWVQLDAYERDLPSLLVGQGVRVSVEALPGDTFEGRLAFIDPTVDAERRAARVRVEVDNPDGRLRPGMFAQAVVQGQAGGAAERPLVIPRTAALFTGRRSLVYVEVPGAPRPTYDARIVRLGPLAGDVYPVVAGLAEGERIVTRGAFVLDADLQIRGGRSMMVGPDDTDEGPWDEAIELPSKERAKLRPIADGYLTLQRALAADDLGAAQHAAAALPKAVRDVTLERPAKAKDAWPPIAEELRQHAQHVAQADSLEAARGPFEGLSAAVTTLLRRFGNPLDQPLEIAFCPMASGRGAMWIQQGKTIDNPYFGETMRRCGELRETVPQGGGYLSQPAAPPEPARAPAPEGHRH
jgi:membrane fusion protein, copper/silver efflux system